MLAIYFLLVDVLLLGLSFYLYSKRKFWAVVKNFRPLRSIHCIFLLLFGSVLFFVFANKSLSITLFDISFVVSTLLALFFAGMHAVWENDEIDVKIDSISNKKRPLPQYVLSPIEWKNIKYIFLFVSLGFAFLTSYYTFILILLFLGLFHIYSTPPLRIKTVPILSSVFMALGGLIITLLGFFAVSGTENLRAFPVKYAIYVFFVLLFVENVKNIRDIDGDSADGIKTIPVLLGKKKSKKVFGFISFLACLSVSIFLYPDFITILTSLIFGIFLFKFINKKDYQEKYVFLTYFVFIIIFLLEILLLK